jgi:hypothetical protein
VEYETATTVGYGDQYPTTMGWRIVGLVMLTVGVGLFATFSDFLADTDQQRATAVLRSRIAELESPA